MINAVYDLQCSPPTFDFVGFLVSAEMERKRLGEDGIRIFIAAGPDNGFRRDNLPPRSPKHRRMMLENIVFKMAKLLPSCVSIEEGLPDRVDFPNGWSKSQRINHYGGIHVVKAWKEGVFPLRATKRINGERLITFSLRESHYWPSRNVNRDAWITLGAKLLEKGLRVGVIPDVDAKFAYPMFEVFDKAAFDVEERAAVYESSMLNLFIAHGPMAMASFMNDVNSLVFRMTSKGAVCVDPGYWAGCGFPVGSVFPRKNFRIVWKDDSADVLLEETFKELHIMEAACLQ